MRVPRRALASSLVPLALLMSFAFLSVTASVAKDKDKKETAGEEIRVLANLPLKDMRVNQMFLQKWGEKVYLYLHRPAEDVYALVDVTNPDKPTLLNANALKGTTAEGTAGGSPVAITATEEGKGQTAAAELPKQTINFVDTTDPKGLKTVQSFKGVTSMYSDDARKLVYLVNDEGLWIVRHRSPMPLCSGDSKAPNCPAIPGP
jgi:hypothetical protein